MKKDDGKKSGDKTSFTTGSEEETRALGARIARAVGPGAWIALDGILGSGKTRLVKGIAEGLGVEDPDGVASPTYTICAEYQGRVRLYHFDAYRLSGAADFEDAAGEALYDPRSVAAVEWAEKVVKALPVDRLNIEIEITGETERVFVITATGEKSRLWLGNIAGEKQAQEGSPG